MTRKILLAATVALAAASFSAAPAQAHDKLFKFVAGATALVILNEALNSSARPHHHGHRHVHHTGRRPMHFHGNFRHRHPHTYAHRHPRLRGGYWQR